MEAHAREYARYLRRVPIDPPELQCRPQAQRNDEEPSTCGILQAAGVDQGAAAVTPPKLAQRAAWVDLKSSPFSASDPSSRLPLPLLPSMHHHRSHWAHKREQSPCERTGGMLLGLHLLLLFLR